VRYICLLAILLALPETVSAQVAIRAGRGSGPRSSAGASSDEERTARPRNNDGSNRGSNGRSAVRSDEGSNARSSAGSNQRQNDRRNNRGNDHKNDRQVDRFNGLGPLGLPPVQQQPLPWWEQRQLPWWEQPRTTSGQRQSQAQWEQQLVNPSRAAIEANRKLNQAQRVQRRHAQPTVIYALPPYRYFYPNTTYGYGVESTTYITSDPPGVVAAPPAPEVTTGFLRLEVEPRELLQVFVDGLYVGTPADLGDEFEVRLGARRIELRAPGYRTLTFDTEIVPDRTIAYRGQLDPMSTAAAQAPRAPAPQAPQAPAGARTIYLIPGCYIGNVAPTADMVRPGCDISKVITRAPQ
jgi:hypothetical protein